MCVWIYICYGMHGGQRIPCGSELSPSMEIWRIRLWLFLGLAAVTFTHQAILLAFIWVLSSEHFLAFRDKQECLSFGRKGL